jgi:hypothetical protein
MHWLDLRREMGQRKLTNPSWDYRLGIPPSEEMRKLLREDDEKMTKEAEDAKGGEDAKNAKDADVVDQDMSDVKDAEGRYFVDQEMPGIVGVIPMVDAVSSGSKEDEYTLLVADDRQCGRRR